MDFGDKVYAIHVNKFDSAVCKAAGYQLGEQ